MDITPSRLIKSAEEVVRARLQQRPRMPLTVSASAGGTASLASEFADQVERLTSVIGVDADHLRPTDRLGDIFRVDATELPQDMRPLLRKFVSGDHMRVFGFEVFDLLERRIAQNRSILEKPPFVPTPKSEDEWMERIMGMTVAELLSVLA